MNTPPVVSVVITPSTVDDGDRLRQALEQLTAGDRRLRVLSKRAAPEIEIGCVSERHLAETVDRLHRDFAVNATLSRPRVLYREIITRDAQGEAKYAKQVSGRGQYAHVKIRVSPRLQGDGRIVENANVGGSIPGEYLAAVERGIVEALDDGVVAAHPIEDVRVEIFDGSYHDVDSTEAAFTTAARLAAQNAVRSADPVVMEPLLRVEVIVPPEFTVDVTNNLLARRGHALASETRGGTRLIRALVPAAEFFGYECDLRERTFGRGSYTAEFDCYVPLPARNDDERAAPVAVPRRPSPKPRDSAIALPEPDEEKPV